MARSQFFTYDRHQKTSKRSFQGQKLLLIFAVLSVSMTLKIWYVEITLLLHNNSSQLPGQLVLSCSINACIRCYLDQAFRRENIGSERDAGCDFHYWYASTAASTQISVEPWRLHKMSFLERLPRPRMCCCMVILVCG